METQTLKRPIVSLMSLGFIVLGIYNSVVINSDAFMDSQNVKFVKRLDEINGITTKGRQLANAGEWVKLKALPQNTVKSPMLQDKLQLISSSSRKEVIASNNLDTTEAQAAIQEDLSLELVEVFNAKKYQQAPKASDFSGQLTATDGVIDSISVSLPNSESISISFAQMVGNVFEYDYNGQVLSGMLYQMDKTSYMVTLTNGHFEGTRLKFQAKAETQEEIGNGNEDSYGNNAQIAENNNVEVETDAYAAIVNDDGSEQQVGTFGVTPQVPQADETAQSNQVDDSQAYGFRF
jgi:hypothetical protein